MAIKKLLTTIAVLALLVIATCCGPAGGPTPTLITLATPTPRPAPPTPTPIPPTPTSETKQGTPGPSRPAVTDIVVEIPAGPFTMGSDKGDPEDAPAHEVDLPVFEIDRFEVTNADFATFVKETGYVTFAEQKGFRSWRDQAGMGKERHPVVMVTWDDAAAYCRWLGKRLPTESEWEKAARGGDGRTFPWGEGWDPNKANVKETGLRGTAVVGSFGAGASPYGVEELIGNVWEWTADWYQPYPGNTTPDVAYGEKYRVTRGGGWFELEAQATTFNRNAADPKKTANDDLGFRCARQQAQTANIRLVCKGLTSRPRSCILVLAVMPCDEFAVLWSRKEPPMSLVRDETGRLHIETPLMAESLMDKALLACFSLLPSWG